MQNSSRNRVLHVGLRPRVSHVRCGLLDIGTMLALAFERLAGWQGAVRRHRAAMNRPTLSGLSGCKISRVGAWLRPMVEWAQAVKFNARAIRTASFIHENVLFWGIK
jgi:hypothetical protein